MSRLPPEVVDSILSYFQTPRDHKTLSSCSLVCLEWLPISRERLFAAINLHEMRASDPSSSRRDLETFLNVIDTSPEIGLSVRRLVVRSRGGRTTLSYQSLVSVLHQLPRLQHLVLHDMYLPGIFPDDLCENPCSSLEKLSLVDIFNPSQSTYGAATIFHFLQLFSYIREIEFKGVHLFRNTLSSFYDDVFSHSPDLATFKMSNLTLDSREQDNMIFLQMLQDAAVVENMESLKIIMQSFALPLAPLSCLLSLGERQCGIRTLMFEFQPRYGIMALAEQFSSAFQADIQHVLRPALQKLSRLRSFHLMMHSVYNPPPLWHMCLAQIHALPSSVSEVHIYMKTEFFPFNIAHLRQVSEKHRNITNFYLHTHRHMQIPKEGIPDTLGNAVVHLVCWQY